MHLAWGLCTRCYHRNRRTDTLHLFGRSAGWPPAELAECIKALTSAGYEAPQIFGVLTFTTIDEYLQSVAMLQRKGLL